MASTSACASSRSSPTEAPDGNAAEPINELTTDDNIGNIAFEAGDDPEGAEDIEFKSDDFNR